MKITKSGSIQVFSKPVEYWAKQIKEVRCVNPDEKIGHHYLRLHELTFHDDTKCIVNEDHWRRPGSELKEGNWVVIKNENLTESYYTPEQFDKAFSRIDL